MIGFHRPSGVVNARRTPFHLQRGSARSHRITRHHTKWDRLLSRIIDQFEEQQRDNPGGSLYIDRDMDALLSSKYAMTMIFRSQDDAERAGPVLLYIPGVVNVRFGGKTLDSDPA